MRTRLRELGRDRRHLLGEDMDCCLPLADRLEDLDDPETAPTLSACRWH